MAVEQPITIIVILIIIKKSIKIICHYNNVIRLNVPSGEDKNGRVSNMMSTQNNRGSFVNDIVSQKYYKKSKQK